MKNHTKQFLKSRGHYQPNMIADDLVIMCEYCKAKPMVDVNHISPRGMGSSKKKDDPYNLIGMCRECHRKFESKEIPKEICYKIVGDILFNLM
jgi:hypothetical protein